MELFSPMRHESLMIHRLGDLLKERGAKKRLADAINKPASVISDICSGKDRLNDDLIELISGALNIPAWQLFVDPAEVEGDNVSLHHVRVLGEIRAGIWQEAVQWDDDKIEEIPHTAPAPYRDKAYGLRVVGDSMNLLYPEGTIVIVVPVWEYNGPMPGKRVVVERRKRDGTIEATAKELEVVDGRAKLWPRSTNPRFQTPIDISWPYDKPQDIGLETVEIKGIIIGSYRSEE